MHFTPLRLPLPAVGALTLACLLPVSGLMAQSVSFSGPFDINAFETPTGIVDLFCEDLDGDGDMDALAHLRASSEAPGSFMKFLNEGGGVFDIGTSFGELDSLHLVLLGDLNLDQSPDIIAMNRDSIFWFENVFGLGNFSQQPAVFVAPGEARITAMQVGDLDGDSQGDLLVALADSFVVDDTTRYAMDVHWFEEEGGVFVDREAALFSLVSSIPADTSSSVLGLQCLDINLDGDQDVLVSVLSTEVGLVVHHNPDGLGGFTEAQSEVRDSLGFGGVVLELADFDGDGDPDLLSRHARAEARRIVWHENRSGIAPIGAEELISSTGASLLHATAGDLDEDGETDVIVCDYLQRNVGWYMNIDSLDAFILQDILANTDWYPLDQILADLDGDGDQDILTVERFQEFGSLQWYRNNTPIVGVTEPAPAPATPLLTRVHPNPFNPTTTVRITMDRSAPLRLSLVNVLGQVAAVPLDETLPAGVHDLTIDAGNLAGGVYFLHARTEGRPTETARLLLLK